MDASGAGSMRWLYRFAVGFMLLSLMAADANAEKRVALVIGNGAYKNVPTLPNPPNDATDVAAALRRSGFDVFFETNLDQIGMQDASIRFCTAAADHWRSAETVGTVNAFEDHIVRFPTCAFTGLAKSRIAALSKPGAAVPPSNPFDGIWIVREICEKKAPSWQAGTYQFAGRIKDRIFHYQYGEEGKPGSASYDGKIEADGTSEISVKGLTGDAAYDPFHRAPGTEFHFKMVIKLEGSRGAGVRSDSPRPCRSEWSMLSSTAASTPNANSDSPEKSTADDVSNPGSEKPKLRKDADPVEIKHPKAVSQPTRDGTVAAIAPDRHEPEASRNRQVV
jgi:hypothetical protein